MAANPGVIGLSQAAIEEKWARLVARGGELLTHMRNDKDTSQQSPFLDPKQDFTRHGWTRLVFPQTNYATAHSAQLHNLRGVEGLATASSISTVNCMNQRWWHAINAVQDRPSFVNPQSHEPKLVSGYTMCRRTTYDPLLTLKAHRQELSYRMQYWCTSAQ